MARSYAKLLTSIWRDDDFRALDALAQRLYMLLISQPELSSAGVLPMRVSKWAKLASDTNPEGIETAFETLIATRFVMADEHTEEVLIRSFIRHDGGWVTPNIHKAIISAIANIESMTLQFSAGNELANLAGHKPCETLPLTLAEQIPQQSSQQPSPSAFNQQQQPAAAPNPTDNSEPSTRQEAAAAAVEICVQHRMETNRPNNRSRYATQTRRNIFEQQGTDLLKAEIPAHSTDHARWLAVNVLGLSVDQAMAAAFALRSKKNGRAA